MIARVWLAGCSTAHITLRSIAKGSERHTAMLASGITESLPPPTLDWLRGVMATVARLFVP